MEICKYLEFDKTEKLECFDLTDKTDENLDTVCELLADYIIEK